MALTRTELPRRRRILSQLRVLRVLLIFIQIPRYVSASMHVRKLAAGGVAIRANRCSLIPVTSLSYP